MDLCEFKASLTYIDQPVPCSTCLKANKKLVLYGQPASTSGETHLAGDVPVIEPKHLRPPVPAVTVRWLPAHFFSDTIHVGLGCGGLLTFHSVSFIRVKATPLCQTCIVLRKT